MKKNIDKLDSAWIEKNIDLDISDALVLFDIDSTIMDTSPRNFAILKEAEKEMDFLRGVSTSLSPESMGWNICSDVDAVRPLSSDEDKKLHNYWKERFFFDPWVRMDTPYPGIVSLLRWLSDAKKIPLVYLTGRDRLNMAKGTIEAFRHYGIPAGAGTSFLFKPSQDVDDLSFKEQALKDIAAMGTVVLAVENEPANANAMYHAFPTAKVALIDTVTAPNPSEPERGIIHFNRYG